ncbi:MAG: DNA polymerase I [Phycisphaerae bacterium]
MATRSLYLIDGHAQIYRAYYAPFGALTSPTGEPTRAVHVFTQMVLNLLRDRRPDYLAMTLDVSDRSVFRVDLDPTYKATRDASPEDLGPQIERIVSILGAMRIPILREEGYEADDLMATLCDRYGREGLDIYLVSRDKDLEQLLDRHVKLYDPGKDVEIDAATLAATKGYGPDQAIEAQMLMGDSTDNIRGVDGVGPKKAAQLLKKYGTVENIVQHADELTPKLRENVLAFRDRMETVRKLVTLRRDVPFDFDLADAEATRFDPAAAAPILQELGLQRLLERLGVEAPASGERSKAEEGNGPGAEGDAAQPADPLLFGSEERTETRYALVDTDAALADLAGRLGGVPAFAFDTETTGLVPVAADLVGLSFAFEPGRGYYVPVRGIGRRVSEDAVRRHLGPVFANERIGKCGQNLKYDVVVLKTLGLEVRGIDFDTMIASFLLDPGRRSHGIDALALDWLGYRKIATQDLIGKGKKQITFDRLPTERVLDYAAEDADIAWRLRQVLEPRLTDPQRRALFTELEMPLLEVLAAMEYRGVTVDTDLLARLSGKMADRLVALEHEIHDAAGYPFNINSTKQLGEVLFDRLGLPVIKRTKTARSTDAEVLATLAGQSGHPLPALVLEHRELSKLKGTYIDALPEMVSERTGRIHPSFHQTGAITGRLSCSDPNLQNIPIRTEAGAQIRRAFVPSAKDHVLLKADYSQIELRVLAHFSGDAALADAFRNDRDIHAFVAAQLAGIPIEQVTREQRSRAKTVNFGIVYGQSAFGLSRQTGMPQGEAKRFIEQYFARYPQIRGFLDDCIRRARSEGFVQTLLGRQRPIPEINSRNKTARSAAERLAANTVIQGTAADLIKKAMVNIHRRIIGEKRSSRMLIQVHDELVFEVPRNDLEDEAAMIAEEMTAAIQLDVPLKVDLACGPNWLDAEELKVAP